MTSEQRIERLERLLNDLACALCRQGTELDGNWSWPYSRDEFQRIALELTELEKLKK